MIFLENRHPLFRIMLSETKFRSRAEKRYPATRPQTLALHVPPLRPPRFLVSFFLVSFGFGPKIALQRTHLEVAPKISFDALRCGDGP